MRMCRELRSELQRSGTHILLTEADVGHGKSEVEHGKVWKVKMK
jgi:hypothetical protein